MYKLRVLSLFVILFNINLLAYNDSDMDGVEDQFDQCQNTPFSELVGKNGCSKNGTLKAKYTILFGIGSSSTSYTDGDNTTTKTKSIQLNYSKNNLLVQVSGSYYNLSSDSYSESGLNDMFVGINYKLKATKNFKTKIGFGIILPIYDTELNNNNADYLFSISTTYPLRNINIFGGYSYTMINDNNIDGIVSYQNTNGYNLGTGYNPTKKTYCSVFYNQSNSVYTGIEDIKTLSLFGLYTIDKQWFTNFTYSYGLSDTASDNYITIKIGYNF